MTRPCESRILFAGTEEACVVPVPEREADRAEREGWESVTDGMSKGYQHVFWYGLYYRLTGEYDCPSCERRGQRGDRD